MNSDPAFQSLPSSSSSSSSLPIYSLATSQNKEFLFVGGADRYVSIFQAKFTHAASSTGGTGLNSLQLELVQRLGPHTGWVKDVAVVTGPATSRKPQNTIIQPVVPTQQSQKTIYSSSSSKASLLRVHSIGCNCVETWKHITNDNNSQTRGIAWKQVGQLSIENSVQGCTLSSDLLCLLAIEENEEDDCLSSLWAGGVDGRIHCWERRASMMDHLDDDCWKHAFVVAHAGRVNNLVHHPASGLVFSASNDGTIQCWKRRKVDTVVGKSTFIQHQCTLGVGGSKNDCARITALTLLPSSHELEETGSAEEISAIAPIWLGFATHNGVVGLTRLDCIIRGDDCDNRYSWSWTVVDKTTIPKEPLVYCLRAKGKVLVAGHAKGLTTVVFQGF